MRILPSVGQREPDPPHPWRMVKNAYGNYFQIKSNDMFNVFLTAEGLEDPNVPIAIVHQDIDRWRGDNKIRTWLQLPDGTNVKVWSTRENYVTALGSDTITVVAKQPPKNLQSWIAKLNRKLQGLD